MEVIIIGSGIAGLSTAIRLARAGYKVTVFESSETPGGKLSEFHQAGYRFDRGPSLFTMPAYVDELFRLCGENPSAHFRYQKLDCNAAYFYPDGTQFSAYADRDKFANEIREKFNVDPAPALVHLDRSEKLYNLTGRLFMERSLELRNFLDRATGRALLRLPFYRLNSTLDTLNKEKLNDPRLVQYFNRYATYNGSDPHRAPAMLHIIPHIEHGIGAFFPEGGMINITKSLYQLALRQGVVFCFNNRVAEIITENKKACGVRVNERVHLADVVVSNMDMTPTYRRLLPKEKAPEKLLAQEKSSSAMIFYWGMKQTFPRLQLHNIFFAKTYKLEFDALFGTKELSEDPTVYVNISSKHNSPDAPAGCENWFVMVNAPNHDGSSWEERVRKVRRTVLNKLGQQLGVSLEPLIECESVWTPEGIEKDTSSFQGALYGNASNSKMAAFLRHKNYSKNLKGLYFCGGSVHPGGGIPLCLLSGKITSELIMERNPVH